MWSFVRISGVVFCAALVTPVGWIASAQNFGGTPPWGLETPTRVRGELRPGRTFKRSIGNGLSLTVTPEGDAWEIQITPTRGRDDYSRCVNPPFHGPNQKDIMAWHFQAGREATPGGVGRKRWIDFALTPQGHSRECHDLEIVLQGKDSTWRSHTSGRCWLRPVSVKLVDGVTGEKYIDSLKFEAECTLRGALELWRLPVTYVFQGGFTGWVTVFYREKGKAGLSRTGDRYVLQIAGSTTTHTSSDLRQDSRGAQFARADGQPVSASGSSRMIWGWEAGDADECSPYQSFFVGTRDQYAKAGENPALKHPVWDCSKVLRIER